MLLGATSPGVWTGAALRSLWTSPLTAYPSPSNHADAADPSLRARPRLQSAGKLGVGKGVYPVDGRMRIG